MTMRAQFLALAVIVAFVVPADGAESVWEVLRQLCAGHLRSAGRAT
jgi:hypothetical protein